MDQPDSLSEEWVSELRRRAGGWIQAAQVGSPAFDCNAQAPTEIAWRNPAPRVAAASAEMPPNWDAD